MVQLRSAAIGWSTDIYLQANQASAATLFYTNLGFEKAEDNCIEELPMDWQTIVNRDNIEGFYLKFIDNETNLREAKSRAIGSGNKGEVMAALHIFHLQGTVKFAYHVSSYNMSTNKLTLFIRFTNKD